MDGNNSLDINLHLEGLNEIREKVQEVENLMDEIENLVREIRYSPIKIRVQTGTNEKDTVYIL